MPALRGGHLALDPDVPDLPARAASSVDVALVSSTGDPPPSPAADLERRRLQCVRQLALRDVSLMEFSVKPFCAIETCLRLPAALTDVCSEHSTAIALCGGRYQDVMPVANYLFKKEVKALREHQG